MRLLLHALSTPEVPANAPSGLRGQRLVRVDEAGLSAWATWFDELLPKFERTDLVANHEIIARLHAQLGACLPARFPTWLVDEDILKSELRRRQLELGQSLEAVRGRCELAVTGVWTEPAEPDTPTYAATPGTRYLMARRLALAGSDERRDRARALADEIERLAGADLVQVRRQVCPSAGVALSAALLTPKATASAVLARLPRIREGVRILVNGPWPPYTFATVPLP